MALNIDPLDFRAKLRAFLREHTLDVLWLIHQGNNTQRRISRELNVNITTISRILCSMEKDGYVVSEPVRTTFSGRPQKKYQLAEKGETLLQAVRAVNEITSSE